MKKLNIFKLFSVLVIASVLFAACATPTTEAPKPTAASKPTDAPKATESPKATEAPKPYPAYYPADYDKIIEASKKEDKGLVVYSIMSETNWAAVSKGFTAKYPWIKLQSLDLGSYEVFERYYSESGSKARTADIIITSAPDAWQEFIDKGELATYKSAEDDKVPAWSKLAPSVYTVSSDPMILISNKAQVKDAPKTMKDLAAYVEKNPTTKVVTYDAEKNATGFAIYWFWLKKTGEAGWKLLETIGKTKPIGQTSAGNMVNSTLAGETQVGFFVSAISVLPKYPQAEPVMVWNMIGDGTPILTRGMGITKNAASPNSAKLLVDYILSQEGQIGFAASGLTAYRPDVADTAKLHLNKLAAQVGEQNLIPFFFDPDLKDKAKKDAFIARWKKTFGR